MKIFNRSNYTKMTIITMWRTGDLIAFSFFIGLGIILVAFPRHVIRFYRWFYKGNITWQEDAKGIKSFIIAGTLWILLMLCLFIFGKPHRPANTKAALILQLPPQSMYDSYQFNGFHHFSQHL